MERRDATVAAVLMVLVVAAGCASGPSAAKPGSAETDLDIAFHLAENSASASRHDGVQTLVVREDGSDDEYIYLALMEDHDTHACRLETLRMSRADRRLERQTYDADGEFLWVSEPPAVRVAVNSISQAANTPRPASAAATLGP